MKKIALILALLATSITFSFSQNVKISGKVINNSKGYTQVTLQNLLTKQNLATSPIANDGSFSFQITINQPEYLGLVLEQNKYLMIVAQPGDNISVTLDANNPNNSTVSGSELTKVLFDAKKIDQQISQELKQCQQKLQQKHKELYKQLVLQNLGKISTIIIAEQLPLDEYYDVHEKLAQSLQPYKSNAYVRQYIKNVNAYGKTKIGTIAPDIALPNPDGDTIRLSSLRGKYVLVDFWAAWCRPCRVESPNLIKAYEKYHDKGFTIYSVSLDRTKQAWLNAIEQDGIGMWYHVSDLKGWRSKAAELYGVNAIPANFLLDPQGRIIAKNLRGEKLQQKLKEIFGE